MVNQLKIGTKVSFRTLRGRLGTGKISGYRNTGRGLWYEVRPTPLAAHLAFPIVCVRASGIEA